MIRNSGWLSKMWRRGYFSECCDSLASVLLHKLRTSQDRTNLLEHPKVGWITEHMHEYIKLSHHQCTHMYTDILLHVGRISIDWSVFISQSPTNWLWGMFSPIGRPRMLWIWWPFEGFSKRCNLIGGSLLLCCHGDMYLYALAAWVVSRILNARWYNRLHPWIYFLAFNWRGKFSSIEANNLLLRKCLNFIVHEK